jgi:hypothetical protein
MFRRAARWGALLPLVVVLLMPEVAHAAAAKPTTTVSIVNGSVAPGGAGITVKYNCFPTGYGPYGSFGDVRVSQANGVTGGASFRPICNDRSQTNAVFVPGNFKKGDAAVNVFVCGFDCNSASKEIKLR